MPKKDIPQPLQLRKTFESVPGTLPPLGRFDLTTATGLLDVTDAPGCTSILLDHDGVPFAVGVLNYEPGTGAESGHGTLHQFDAKVARAFAASMIKLADLIEPPEPAPAPGYFPFNLNEVVRVRLNDQGRAILKEQWEGMVPSLGEFRPPTEDADGWSEHQLWTLFRDFGEHMSVGMHGPFASTIELPIKREP